MIRKVGLFGFQAIVNTIINVVTENSKTVANMDTDVTQLNVIMLL